MNLNISIEEQTSKQYEGIERGRDETRNGDRD